MSSGAFRSSLLGSLSNSPPFALGNDDMNKRQEIG